MANWSVLELAFVVNFDISQCHGVYYEENTKESVTKPR